MLARKVIVFGPNIDSAVKLANCIEEVYFYNINNRAFSRCRVESQGTLIYRYNLVSLLESICVNGGHCDLINDLEEKMEVAESLGQRDIPKEIKKVIEEIRIARYELKSISVGIKIAISNDYLEIDETTEPSVLSNSHCNALMDNRRAYQLKLNKLYQDLHRWFDPLLLRRTAHAI